MPHSTFYASRTQRFTEEDEMQSEYFDVTPSPSTTGAFATHAFLPPPAPDSSVGDAALEVECILADCFFSLGQGVRDGKSVEHSAVIWWRDRYRAKFLGVMHAFGNRWMTDRSRVLAMCRMLGERAVHYAGDAPSIDVGAAMKASADVETFCVRHAQRRQRRLGTPIDAEDPTMYAGYWCAL
jgi:hypothetical protein